MMLFDPRNLNVTGQTAYLFFGYRKRKIIKFILRYKVLLSILIKKSILY